MWGVGWGHWQPCGMHSNHSASKAKTIWFTCYSSVFIKLAQTSLDSAQTFFPQLQRKESQWEYYLDVILTHTHTHTHLGLHPTESAHWFGFALMKTCCGQLVSSQCCFFTPLTFSTLLEKEGSSLILLPLSFAFTINLPPSLPSSSSTAGASLLALCVHCLMSF